jgi:ATP dependent DNA ligase domain
VLTIEPIGLSEIVPQNNGMKARYYHLRVRNVRGRLPAAHEAQVLITRVEKEDAAGQPIILIELNSDDLRRDPLQVRKATLASILAKARPGIRFNEHIEGDGPTVFAHACKMGLEGIVSKRKDSAYRSGRSPDWLKIKNLEAPAVKREAEEDWGRRGRR